MLLHDATEWPMAKKAKKRERKVYIFRMNIFFRESIHSSPS